MYALMAWDNFGKWVFYGWSSWPSYSYWLVPGTVTDESRVGWD
jgi:hypothetical protein